MKNNTNGFVLTQTDKENRKTNYEFWLHDNFIAIHVHGWSDNEKFAKYATRYRYIFGLWYYCYESFIPKHIFNTIVFNEELATKIIEWSRDTNETNNEKEDGK